MGRLQISHGGKSVVARQESFHSSYRTYAEQIYFWNPGIVTISREALMRAWARAAWPWDEEFLAEWDWRRR